MKITNHILCISLALVILVSCEHSGKVSQSVILLPSADRIDATVDSVTFNVFYGEEDVTGEARIFMSPDNKELMENTFSATVPGEYEFYATYRGQFSDPAVVKVSGGLSLSSDKTVFTADGTDMVVFTVTQDGEDVTSESILHIVPDNGTPVAIDGVAFSTTEVGGYNIYATKGAASSNVVSVIAASASVPEQWSFRDRSLLVEITGTWCGPCSLMKAGIKSLEHDGWEEGYVVEAHDGDALSIGAFQSLIDFLELPASFGVPMVTFNFAEEPRQNGLAGGTVAINADRIRQLTDEANEAYPCTAGANAEFFSNTDGGLVVTSDVAVSEDGEYKVSCWLLESNIRMTQTVSYPEANEWEVSTHINVLRAVSDDGDFAGQAVTAGANETQSFEWNFNVSDLRNDDLEETHVLVIVSRKEANGKYIVNNVVRCPYNDAVGFEYE